MTYSYSKLTRAALVLGALSSASCTDASAHHGAIEAFRYEIACGSIQANGREPLLCVKIDTQSGHSWLVNTEQLEFVPDLLPNAVAAPAPASTASASGRFAIACDRTDSSFRCLRLDRATGELGVVPLKALPVFPVMTSSSPSAPQPAAFAAAAPTPESQRLENQ